jgi:hypothetical protein
MSMFNPSDYEPIISEFKREAGKLISKSFPHYGYDVYHPHVTDQLTGMLEKAIEKVEKQLNAALDFRPLKGGK